MTEKPENDDVERAEAAAEEAAEGAIADESTAGPEQAAAAKPARKPRAKKAAAGEAKPANTQRTSSSGTGKPRAKQAAAEEAEVAEAVAEADTVKVEPEPEPAADEPAAEEAEVAEAVAESDTVKVEPEPEPAADEPAAEEAEVAEADTVKVEPEPAADEPAAEEAEPAAKKPRARKPAAKKPAAKPAPKPAPRRKRDQRRSAEPGVEVSAHAKYVRTSARKARLVCDHIRGKDVAEARAILAFTPRAAAKDWAKLLESAVANAEHNHELVGEELRIAAVYADEGPTLKRYRPRAMGRATRIRKRTSHLTITLTPKEL